MPVSSQPYAPTLSTGASSPASSSEPFDYSTAIDPALDGGGTSHVQIPDATYDGSGDYKHPVDNIIPYPLNASDPHNHKGGDSPTVPHSLPHQNLFRRSRSDEPASAHIDSLAKRTKIDDLLAIGGIPPPLQTPYHSIPSATYDEIKKIYSVIYAPAIDKFFETRWFQLRGLSHLLLDNRLCAQFATLIARIGIASTVPNYYHIAAATPSLEATVIWATMNLCRHVANTPNPTNGQVNYLEVNDGVHDAAKRLEIFEHLISGQHMDTEPLKATGISRNGSAFDEQLKCREREFWRLIHIFLTIRDDEASSAKEIDDTLGSCRSLLDSRENRDVIYSIAIARHIGQRMAEFPDNLQQPTSNDEQNAQTKLYVAKKFIEDEATGKGTNQVIQRLCGMAMRSWAFRR